MSDAGDGHEVARAQRAHREIELWLVNERHIYGAHARDDIHERLDGDARLCLGLHASGRIMLFGTHPSHSQQPHSKATAVPKQLPSIAHTSPHASRLASSGDEQIAAQAFIGLPVPLRVRVLSCLCYISIKIMMPAAEADYGL